MKTFGKLHALILKILLAIKIGFPHTIFSYFMNNGIKTEDNW